MLVFLSIFVAILVIAVLWIFRKLSVLNDYMDELYHKVYYHEGVVQDLDKRCSVHYNNMATLNAEIEKVREQVHSLHKKSDDNPQPDDLLLVPNADTTESVAEPKEMIEETPTDELAERRVKYAEYRKQGKGVKDAGDAVGVSYSTAKRYERWRKDNKK